MSRTEWAYFTSLSRDVKIAPHPILERVVTAFLKTDPPKPNHPDYSDHVAAVAKKLSKEKHIVQIVSRPGVLSLAVN